MDNFKILLFVFLLFNFSICANESNAVKNSFDPNETFEMDCKNSGSIDLYGKWDNSDNYPPKLDFKLKLKEGNELNCSFDNSVNNIIKCTGANKQFTLSFSEQAMDSNSEYILKARKESTNVNCLSSYIYSNIILIFLIIFILIN